MSNDSIFQTLHHICIVIRNIDDAVRYYESIGVGPWQSFPSLEPFRNELDMRDADSFMKHKYRFANLGNVQLQLCEPAEGDTAQRRFLDTHGEGVFHLGFSVDDVDAAEATGRAAGMQPIIHGRLPDRSGFTYFDTQEKAGVTLQIRAMRKPAPA